jgi:drug/metabolite transporter (DMT)-like permease
MKKLILNPYFKVITAALLWSTSGIFIRVLKLSPGIFSFYRMAIPALFLFIFLKIKKEKLIKGSIRLLLLGSLLNAARLFLYYISFNYTSLGNAIIILYTWPVFMTILGFIFLKERINLRNIVLLITTFLGIIVVFIKKGFSFQDRG